MVIYIIVLGYIYIDSPGKVLEKIQIFICHPKQIN